MEISCNLGPNAKLSSGERVLLRLDIGTKAPEMRMIYQGTGYQIDTRVNNRITNKSE